MGSFSFNHRKFLYIHKNQNADLQKIGAKICINIQTKMFCFFSEVIIGNGYLQVCVAIRANGHIRLFIVLKSTIQCVGFFHKALSVADSLKPQQSLYTVFKFYDNRRMKF